MRFPVLSLLILGFPHAASADVIPMKEGEVYCVAYDEKTDSCATVQTMKDLGDGRYRFVDLSGFSFNALNLDMISSFEAYEEDGKLCVAKDGFQIAIEPKDNKLAQGWRNLMQYQMDEMSAQGYCFEHEKCGDEWIAIGSLDGERRQDLAMTFRVFDADDPRAESVQPRYLSVEEIGQMQKEMAEKCVPTDT